MAKTTHTIVASLFALSLASAALAPSDKKASTCPGRGSETEHPISVHCSRPTTPPFIERSVIVTCGEEPVRRGEHMHAGPVRSVISGPSVSGHQWSSVVIGGHQWSISEWSPFPTAEHS